MRAAIFGTTMVVVITIWTATVGLVGDRLGMAGWAMTQFAVGGAGLVWLAGVSLFESKE